MAWNRRDEDWQADRHRDERKHEPRPGDRDFPARFQTPLSTAMDLVVCVKAMDNYSDAAALIERFIKDRADEKRMDAVAAGARP